MRNLIIIAAIIISVFSACGPTEEKRKDANDVYNATLKIVESVNQHDSAYVQCMQYLMCEIQTPDLKKNKKKSEILKDSISLLDDFNDSLVSTIDVAQKKVVGLRSKKPDFDLYDSADSLLSKYKEIANDVYPDINSRMKKISFPVKNDEYTMLLRLSYNADSVLNAAITSFNAESAAFNEKYKLKEFRK